MILRHAAKRVAVSLAATAATGTVAALMFMSPAGAAPVSGAPLDNGGQVGVTQAQDPFTPGAPFDSGQRIDVSMPANDIFDGSHFGGNNNTKIEFVECSAPNGVLPTSLTSCDGNTIATDFPASDGSFDFLGDTGNGYEVFHTPDSNIGDSPSGPACGNTVATECVLYIGDDLQNLVSSAHVFSQPFLVNPDATDSGTSNPGDGAPEVPLAIVLPIAAMGALGGVVLIRRRRSAHAA